MKQAYMVADIFQLPEIVGCDDRRQIPVFHIGGKQALYCLAHDRIQSVKGLVAEQILCISTNPADHGHLFFHSLGKSVDPALFIQSKTF